MAANSPPNAANRPYGVAHFAMELDGKQDIGLFKTIEGGGLKADVMSYQSGGHYERWRQLGKPKFEDIKLQVGMAMSEPFYTWIKDFFDGKAVRKTGSVIVADFYYKERARRTFAGAMIKELTFPKLGGDEKGPAYMNIGISVEDIEFKKGTGDPISPPKGFDPQKLWTSNNFTFKLDDYADACINTVKVDSFTIKQNVIDYHMGGHLAPTKTPSAIDFPNLVFYVPESDAQPLIDHCVRRAAKGEVRPTTSMHGQLDTRDNGDDALFTLEFFGADIISVTPDRSEATSDDIKLVKVELYIEKMTFKYSGT
jgi:phage tail-like protein